MAAEQPDATEVAVVGEDSNNEEEAREERPPLVRYVSGKDLLRLAQQQQEPQQQEQQGQQTYDAKETKAEDVEQEGQAEIELGLALLEDPFLPEHDPFEPLTQEEAEEEDFFASLTPTEKAAEAAILREVFGEDERKNLKRKKTTERVSDDGTTDQKKDDAENDQQTEETNEGAQSNEAQAKQHDKTNSPQTKKAKLASKQADKAQ
ncbi:hypothetical protein QOT17_018317 [Balamuthia mandrillaris]